MVTSQDDPSCPAYGYPACRLKSLCCLIDKESREMLSVEYAVGCSYECGSYYTCLPEEVGINGYLQFRLTASESVHLLMPVFCSSPAHGSQFPDGLAYGP